MSRSPSFVLFGLTLCLSLAFVIWWTIFQAGASRQLAAAGERLAVGDTGGVAAAFGVADGAGVRDLAHARYWMFVSEGAVFGLVLLVAGALFAASSRREAALRAAQNRFLAGATHELKTPLATISLLLESLRDDRLAPAKRAHYLNMGLLEADRLERGLTNVLVAAGLRTTKHVDRRILGNLADDLRSALDSVAPRAAAARVHIESRIGSAVETARDPEAVQLIVHNLLENAIKYSPPESTVAMELDADPAEARITVRDSGRGLDAHELAHAFEPFWRGKDLATGGSGLGLHLVRQLAEAHGGSVSARSSGRGAGAEFVVRLPRHAAGRAAGVSS
ncbi:MAG: HAMP domain-containing histidine kinase [Planctomycetes bacterium]|nr:HAMP domain-containing histidine kinase [Planctomycetota bacterium]